MSDAPINPVSLASSLVSPVIKLRDEIKKYLKKKRTKNLLLSALEKEANDYEAIMEEMSAYGSEQVRPALLAIKSAPTITQMNDLMLVSSKVPLLCTKLIIAFINFSRACSEVSKMEGFMRALEETNLAMFDFVKRMAAVYVPDNKVVIDGTFFRYFKMYQNDFPKFNDKETTSEIEEVRKSIRHVKKWVQHARTRTPRIDRKICRVYLKNLKKFGKSSAGFSMKYSGIMDMQDYMPSSLSPIISVMEEIF